jgi:hypothetical protein
MLNTTPNQTKQRHRLFRFAAKIHPLRRGRNTSRHSECTQQNALSQNALTAVRPYTEYDENRIHSEEDENHSEGLRIWVQTLRIPLLHSEGAQSTLRITQCSLKKAQNRMRPLEAHTQNALKRPREHLEIPPTQRRTAHRPTQNSTSTQNSSVNTWKHLENT